MVVGGEREARAGEALEDEVVLPFDVGAGERDGAGQRLHVAADRVVSPASGGPPLMYT